MYPMKMKPVFKDYLWGGEQLVVKYGKQTDLRPVAESWEVSCYPGCESVVDNGGFKGQKLSEVLLRHPEMTGASIGETGEFPVLIKLIDAKQQLSLQVHPDDEYAKRVENQQGKNEMWYIVDCQEGAELIIGFNAPLSKRELELAIHDGTILDKVNRVPVKPGDCFSIQAGQLHAIGAGILVAEIQQSSNVTYRVYDYNRKGADGKLRELHIEKAVEVMDSNLKCENSGNREAERFDGYTETQLTDWDYFSAKLICVDGRAEISRDVTGFGCLLVVEGDMTVESEEARVPVSAGQSVFIPAGLGKYSLSGRARVLHTDCTWRKM